MINWLVSCNRCCWALVCSDFQVCPTGKVLIHVYTISRENFEGENFATFATFAVMWLFAKVFSALCIVWEYIIQPTVISLILHPSHSSFRSSKSSIWRPMTWTLTTWTCTLWVCCLSLLSESVVWVCCLSLLHARCESVVWVCLRLVSYCSFQTPLKLLWVRGPCIAEVSYSNGLFWSSEWWWKHLYFVRYSDSISCKENLVPEIEDRWNVTKLLHTCWHSLNMFY